MQGDGMRVLTRRAALLGSAGLLVGCESVSETFDNWFGEKKTPLRGDRLPVLTADRPLGAEAENNRPVSLPPAVLNPDWPQAGGTVTHVVGHPALGAGLQAAWFASIGTGASYRRRLLTPPIVAGGTVFAMDAYGEITALDAATGRQRWTLDTRKEKESAGALGGGIAFEGGTLYVTTSLAEAMSVDPATGAIGWRVPLPAPTRGSPAVAAGRIVFPTTDNRVLAIATADGKEIWTHRGQPVTTMVLGLPAPAIQGDTVVAGLASGEVIALRATDGRVIWSEALASARGGGLADITAIAAMPVIDGNRVIAAGLGGIVIALDLRSGRRLWEREATLAEAPWAAGDWLFIITTGGDLACLGRDDGRVRWLTPLGRFKNREKQRDPITWGAPTLAGDRLFVGGNHGILVEVNPLDGTKRAEVKLSDGLSLPPAVAGGTLFLLTDDARLTAFRGG